MDVLVTCKYEEDPIKNEGAKVDATLYSNFSDAQGQITIIIIIIIKTLFKEEAQLDVHPIFPGVLI